MWLCVCVMCINMCTCNRHKSIQTSQMHTQAWVHKSQVHTNIKLSHWHMYTHTHTRTANIHVHTRTHKHLTIRSCVYEVNTLIHISSMYMGFCTRMNRLYIQRLNRDNLNATHQVACGPAGAWKCELMLFRPRICFTFLAKETQQKSTSGAHTKACEFPGRTHLATIERTHDSAAEQPN